MNIDTAAPSVASNGNGRQQDAALMRRVAAEDPAAARSLVDRHLSPMVGLGFRMLGDRARAEDLAQEAFLRLWRQAPHWKPAARIGTWLYRVVHNLAVDELRRGKRWSDDAVPDTADPALGIFEARHATEVSAAVDTALRALPARQRTALALVFFESLSNIEAAEIMNISVDALESLLARGRRTLKSLLNENRGDLVGEL